MIKTHIIVALLCLISAVLQLLPVLSAPITGASSNYSLHLAKYNGMAFGVFGICFLDTNNCTGPAIGYNSGGMILGDENDNTEAISLPSDARSSISKLLVVHVLAFALAAILVVFAVLTMGVVYSHQKFQKQNKQEGMAVLKRTDLMIYLNFQLLFALLSCLFTLLGLLSDVLLFVPHLSYLGWIQIIPIVMEAVVAMFVCFMRRSIFSRRHLDEDYFYENDDMRVHNNVDSYLANSGSDDGFYVYTNGFYSNYGDREEHNQSQQSNTNSWRRHSPYNEETSIASGDGPEHIPMDTFRNDND